MSYEYLSSAISKSQLHLHTSKLGIGVLCKICVCMQGGIRAVIRWNGFLVLHVQFVILVGLYVFGYDHMKTDSKNWALYWLDMFISIAIVVLQLYTFVIYQAIWKSTCAKQQSQSPSIALPADIAGSGNNSHIKKVCMLLTWAAHAGCTAETQLA